MSLCWLTRINLRWSWPQVSRHFASQQQLACCTRCVITRQRGLHIRLFFVKRKKTERDSETSRTFHGKFDRHRTVPTRKQVVKLVLATIPWCPTAVP
jgi:hypothetical protein